MRENYWNSNLNFDAGPFSRLETKLVNSGLDVKTFINTFDVQGVYVFADSADKQTIAMVVKVVAENDDETCGGRSIWPLTDENLENFAIQVFFKKRIEGFTTLTDWTPFICIVGLFVCVFIQARMENSHERRERLARAKREKVNMDIYFKPHPKSWDNFHYMADLYKIIDECFQKTNKRIKFHERLVQEDGKLNFNEILKKKYSLLTDLTSDATYQDMDKLKNVIRSLCGNLRFQDGSGLSDIVEHYIIENKLFVEEDRLKKLNVKSDSSDSDAKKGETTDDQKDSFNASDDAEDSEKEYNDDAKLHSAVAANPALYSDLLKTREQMTKKREVLADSLDENLTEEQRKDHLNKFDTKLNQIEQSLLTEQEQQAANLKARLAARKRKIRPCIDEVNAKTAEEQQEIKDLKAKVDELNEEKETIESNGVETKALKKERAKALADKMKEFDQDRDKKIN